MKIVYDEGALLQFVFNLISLYLVNVKIKVESDLIIDIIFLLILI